MARAHAGKYVAGMAPNGRVTITLCPARFARVMAVVIAALAVLHVMTVLLAGATGADHSQAHPSAGVGAVIAMFDLNRERNLPTWISTGLLALCAAGAAWTWSRRRGERDRGYWLGLAGVFGLMSLDEASELHERLNDRLRPMLEGDAGGLLHYPWVLAGGAAAVMLAAVYAGFLYRLPRGIAGRIVLAGCLFVVGAVGCVLFEGVIGARGGPTTPALMAAFTALVVVEECLEMTSAALFVHTLMRHELEHPPVEVGRVAQKRPRAPGVPEARDAGRAAGKPSSVPPAVSHPF
jgi:hypothetical protein